jgi:tetratricopeptide (TPR) repeat protein
LPLFEELYKEQPEQARFAQHLAQCYFSLRQTEAAKRVLTELIARQPAPPKQETKLPAAGDAVAPAGDAAAVPAPETVTETPQPLMPPPWAYWLMGVIQFEEGKTEEALESLLRAEQSDPHMPDLHVRIGQTYLRLRRLDDAERAFRKALDIDGDSPEAHLGLARLMLRRR